MFNSANSPLRIAQQRKRGVIDAAKIAAHKREAASSKGKLSYQRAEERRGLRTGWPKKLTGRFTTVGGRFFVQAIRRRKGLVQDQEPGKIDAQEFTILGTLTIAIVVLTCRLLFVLVISNCR